MQNESAVPQTGRAMIATSHDMDVRRAYARDVSGLELVPELVARPSSREETVEVIKEAFAEGVPITTAGGQSSTTGASITDAGCCCHCVR